MRWFERIEEKRAPDFVIGDPDDPYMLRWWVIPRNQFFNIYLHKFIRPDEDPELHDHPWPNFSYLLHGWYIEQTPTDMALYSVMPWATSWRGRSKFRMAHSPHRICEVSTKSNKNFCWSLFITGPVIRRWGFHCKNGWKYWKTFLADKKANRGGCA